MEADSFDNVPSVQVREELDDVIHIEEVRKAVKQMKTEVQQSLWW